MSVSCWMRLVELFVLSLHNSVATTYRRYRYSDYAVVWMANKSGLIFTRHTGFSFQQCPVWCSDVHRHIRRDPFSWCKAARLWNWPLSAIYCRDYKFLQQYLHSRLNLRWIKHNVPYLCLPHLSTLVLQRLKFSLLVYPPGSLCRHFDTQWTFICPPGCDGDTLFSVSERCRGSQWGRCVSCFWFSLSSVTVSSFSVAQYMAEQICYVNSLSTRIKE